MVGPRREESAVLRWSLEGWIVFLESDIDVLQRRRGGCRWTDGEAKTVCLVEVVVRILTDYDGFHGIEGRVSRPGRVSHCKVLLQGVWTVLPRTSYRPLPLEEKSSLLDHIVSMVLHLITHREHTFLAF